MAPVAELQEVAIQSPKTEPQVKTDMQSIPRLTAPSFFANVLLEVDATEKRRRKWSAISTIILQALFLGAVLMVPLMFTEALPTTELVTFLVAPPPPPPPPPAAAAAPVKVIRRVETDISDGHL